MNPPMPNRLAGEKSPYLQQHAGNPVDWYPWGEEAFAEARRSDRPIFLSVGYATCHWCHVMAHESFDDLAIARLLNEHFVPVKVDREERPDIDRIYMTFVQATTGAGGWPMSVWLTPSLKPFFGGTYFPPAARWGRPGFADVLTEIARLWRTDRARIEQAAEAVVAELAAAVGRGAAGNGAGTLSPAEALAAGVDEFRRAFDARHGGFGGAPKFPRPAELLFLLGEFGRRGDRTARDLALATLRAMAEGGLRDQIGGGFHRYAVDAGWRVPHFEKMLYDQAQLAIAYLEAFQASGERFYAEVAAETIDYVRRDLAGPEGGFCSAEDADSPPSGGLSGDAGREGVHASEGAFYVWAAEHVERAAGPDAEIVCQRFGIEPGGNVTADPHGTFRGLNVPYLAQPLEAIAARTGQSRDAVAAAVARGRRALFEARCRRPRPLRDEKILTAWNGLTIAALARAARVLVEWPEAAAYRHAAEAAARFVRERLWDPVRRRLHRRYCAGAAGIDAFAEDYACLVWGLLELVQAGGDPAWLEWALDLQARQDALFWDADEGGWFNTTADDPSVLLRVKEDVDGAEPSAGAVSVLNQIAWAHLTGSADAAQKAERALRRLGPELGRMARAMPMMARALAAWHTGLVQVVIAGDPAREATRRLLAVVAEHYLPFALVIPVPPGERQARLARILPWVAAFTARADEATAYVCRGFVCDRPVTTPEDLRARLERARVSPTAEARSEP
jgi:uncharacterized protein YyaL (SSP411 family)